MSPEISVEEAPAVQFVVTPFAWFLMLKVMWTDGITPISNMVMKVYRHEKLVISQDGLADAVMQPGVWSPGGAGAGGG